MKEKLKPFFVKVLKRSPFTYEENKKYVGQIVQVTKDPINNQYYQFFPPLPIQLLCDYDKNYNRKGYIYGLSVADCEKITDPKNEKIIDAMWRQFKKRLPKKTPVHLTLNSLNKLINMVADKGQ